MKKEVTGQIFNIQRYSTHDGPGVRTTVFLKGCPLRCFWCHNPESQLSAPVLMANESLCTGCGACLEACPNNAVLLINGIAVVDREKCAVCGECVPVCPQKGRSLAGRTASVGDVMDIILRDLPLYENSGGGVTVSGGEPTMQPDFVRELLSRCRAEGIHTAVETCGLVRWEVLESLIPLLDLCFYDIKAVDAEQHRRGTGADNATILENVKRLAHKVPLCIRMPLIPGFNDDDVSVRNLGRFVSGELGLGCGDVELLKYNNLGESKIRRLGRENMTPLQPQSEERMAELRAVLEEYFPEDNI